MFFKKFIYHNQEGSSLIEILIAISVIMIIALPIFNFTNDNLNFANKTYQRTKMLNIAREEIEKAKNENIDNLNFESEHSLYEINKEMDIIDNGKILTVIVFNENLDFKIKLTRVFKDFENL